MKAPERRYPYNVSGGNAGFGQGAQIAFVSVPLSGNMNFLLSQNPVELLTMALRAARLPRTIADARHLVDFGVRRLISVDGSRT